MWCEMLVMGALATVAIPATASGPREVRFATEDGGTVVADLYGDAAAAVVLAHGAVFDKESWEPLAEELEAAGLRVLAIDFRGYGESRAGSAGRALDLDVLAAVRYLHRQGAEEVSVLGGSMGGGAAAQAATLADRGEIDRLLLLAAAPIADPASMHAESFLFVVSEGDGLASRVRRQFDLAPEPKRLEILPGSAHAQNIFKTDQGAVLTRLIVDSLTGTTSGESATP